MCVTWWVWLNPALTVTPPVSRPARAARDSKQSAVIWSQRLITDILDHSWFSHMIVNSFTVLDKILENKKSAWFFYFPHRSSFVRLERASALLDGIQKAQVYACQLDLNSLWATQWLNERSSSYGQINSMVTLTLNNFRDLLETLL